MCVCVRICVYVCVHMYIWLFSSGSCGIQKSASLAVLCCFPTWLGLSHGALSPNPPRAGVTNTWHCVQFLSKGWGSKFISTWLLCEGLTPWAVSKLRFIALTYLLCSTHIWMERFHLSCRKAQWDSENIQFTKFWMVPEIQKNHKCLSHCHIKHSNCGEGTLPYLWGTWKAPIRQTAHGSLRELQEASCVSDQLYFRA